MNSYKITCAEVNYFEIEVDANSIEEAKVKAKKDINSFEVLEDQKLSCCQLIVLLAPLSRRSLIKEDRKSP